jgi:hypothetical protein
MYILIPQYLIDWLINAYDDVLYSINDNNFFVQIDIFSLNKTYFDKISTIDYFYYFCCATS